MKKRTHLAGLQARAQAAAKRHAQARVVVSRSALPAADGEDGTAAGTVSAELWLYGTVGGYWWGFDSDEVASALRELGDVEEILVRLHSFGGSSIEGIAIANLLANHPARVRIVVDGVAASAASMIALAGDELIMSPGSQFMVHDVWTYTAGNAAELRADADWLDSQSQNYAETYAHRAGGTAADWREVMLANNGDGTWYTAQGAVDAGFADRVENITSTTPPPPMPDADELEDDPDWAAAADWDFEVLLHPAARATWSTWRHSTGAPKPPAASAPGSVNTPEGEPAMAFTPEQLTQMRKDLGLKADADEATIVAALSEVASEAQPAATTLEIPEGHVVIPAAKLADLEAAAEVATTTAKNLHAKERAAFLDSVRDKYLPSSRAGWEAEYDRDEAGVREHFAQAPVLIPTTEAGRADAPTEGADSLADIPDAALEGFAAQLGLTKEALRG